MIWDAIPGKQCGDAGGRTINSEHIDLESPAHLTINGLIKFLKKD